jgi:hypothetical protein
VSAADVAYASPLAHAYALRGIAVMVMLVGLVLFLPAPLPAFGLPVVGALVAVPVGAAVANQAPQPRDQAIAAAFRGKLRNAVVEGNRGALKGNAP